MGGMIQFLYSEMLGGGFEGVNMSKTVCFEGCKGCRKVHLVIIDIGDDVCKAIGRCRKCNVDDEQIISRYSRELGLSCYNLYINAQ